MDFVEYLNALDYKQVNDFYDDPSRLYTERTYISIIIITIIINSINNFRIIIFSF